MWKFRKSLISFVRKCSTASPRLQRKEWESVVGLEVHAQIQANTKLFSPTSVNFGAPVNTLVSLFDASIPGTLPVINRRCVEIAVATAFALSCKVNMTSTFDRKHYFYADLPTGYQITQQRKAIAEYGSIRFPVILPTSNVKPYYKSCGIRQLQLEQDSGKSLHDSEQNKSLIDLNRAGISLMEIVFLPELETGEEAAALVKELILILQSLNACDCRMEEGSLRVDANISVNRPGEDLGIRTEVKNLSSLRSMANAIEYEIDRQIEVLEAGGRIVNETRSFDADRKITLPMRDKEVQQDYRFMPEPNLPPLQLYDDPNDSNNSRPNQVNIASIRQMQVILPDVVRQNLLSKYKLRIETANSIVSNPAILDYFKDVMSLLPDNFGVRTAHIILTEMMEEIHNRNLIFKNVPVASKYVAELVQLIENGKIDIATVKNVLKFLFDGDKRTAVEIVEMEGWIKVTDDDLILELCKKVIQANPKVVKEYNEKKKPKILNKLIGQTRQSTTEKLDMKKVSEIILKLVTESKP